MKRKKKTTYYSPGMTINEIKEEMGPNTTVKILGNGKVVLTQIEEKVVSKREVSLNLDVETQFIQIYLGFYERLIAKGKSTSAQSLLTYVLKYKMGTSNNFLINKQFFEDYLDYIKRLTGEERQPRYIQKVLQDMVDDGFFIRLDRGYYKVNPEGFWNGNSKDRKEEIIELANMHLLEASMKESEKRTYLGTKDKDGNIG